MALLAQHYDKLSVLKSLVEDIPPEKRTRSAIANQFAAQIGVSEQDAWQMVVQLMSFHQLRETFALSPSDMFDAIVRSLEREAPLDWQQKNLKLWKDARQTIESISKSDHPLYFVQKTLRLKYEHPNILRDASILVDARPVFDEAGTDIVQWAIDYVLQVDYHDGGNRRQLFATLDIQDVRKLRLLCERAEAKTVALAASLAATKRPVVVTGGGDDDD